MKDILQIKQNVTPIAPEVLGNVFGFPITNSFALTLVVVLIVVSIAFLAVPRFKKQPARFQSLIEVLYEHMVSFITQITSSKKLARDIIPLIVALFVFIGLSNLIGLIPGVSSITWNGIGLFRSPTSDFNTTFGLALAVIILIQIDSMRVWGFWGYVGRFIKFKELWQGIKGGYKTAMMALIEFGIGLLDIVSELAKIISLSFRLFGNMFAGEVLMVLTLSAFAFFLPALWFSMSTLFALVQAIVFGALAAAYYTLAMREEKG
jgi:F-type H+-transporting ATPase subunit a